MDHSTRLETEKIPKLMAQFSIPAIAGMLVNALYNVVDRIFVGQGVGETAIGALTVCGAYMAIILAFAMLIGTGSANLISIRLGQKNKEDAQAVLNHCFLLLIALSAMLMAVSYLFLEPLLVLFGAKDASIMGYAKEYLTIIILGIPFQMVGFGLNHCTRAQGFPVITMVSMVVGAVINIVLDPIFIFGLGWGVAGAAIATILSQLVSMIWMLTFNFSNKPSIRISLKGFRPSWALSGEIMMFGGAQFGVQFSAGIVMTLLNNTLYQYGGAMAQSGMGIVTSVSNVLLMPLFGINQGAQPILGYNYGAQIWSRVKKTYWIGVLMGTVYAVLGFVAICVFPEALVHLFTSSGSPELVRFARKAMVIYHLWLPLLGYQIFSSNYFQATGRPKSAMLLSFLRQIIVLIPLILILPLYWGLEGVVWAMPLSDTVSFLVTSIFMLVEKRRMKRLEQTPNGVGE